MVTISADDGGITMVTIDCDDDSNNDDAGK